MDIVPDKHDHHLQQLVDEVSNDLANYDAHISYPRGPRIAVAILVVSTVVEWAVRRLTGNEEMPILLLPTVAAGIGHITHSIHVATKRLIAKNNLTQHVINGNGQALQKLVSHWSNELETKTIDSLQPLLSRDGHIDNQSSNP